jgi:membrane fusion protein, multidrug efflux system
MKPYLALLPAAAMLLVSCGGEPPRREAAAQAPVAVQLTAASTVEWPATYEATGTVRARTTTTISSKVMGYVREVHAQVGDHVQQGQTLIVLDARDLDANLRRAEAGRAEVESAVPELDNATAAAKANLDLARTTYKRMQELAGKKSISSQEMDEATARLKAAESNYEMIRSRRGQIDSKRASVEEEIRAARITRDYATIAAPFSGRVIARTVEPGALASPGVPLLTIEQDGVYRFEASVDESKLASIRAGQAVDVAIDAAGGKRSARVSEIVPEVNAASRSYTVKIDLPASPELRSGMFGRALFAIGAQKVLAVPAVALFERGQLQSVFVVEDGTAHTRLVTTGRRDPLGVEVLSGLSAGDRIVSPIPAALLDGSKVEVR